MVHLKSPTITHLQGNRIDLLDSLPKKSVCAELGVFCGDFSAEILKHCQPKRLYLVDIFSGKIYSGDADGNHVHEAFMPEVRWDLEVRFRSKPVSVVASDSIGWLTDQKMDSLDWCYIDTSHEYERTAGELIAARGAVADHGFICGHDYHKIFPGVVQAVNYFCAYHDLTLEVFDGDKLPSYRILNRKNQSAEQPLGSERLP